MTDAPKKKQMGRPKLQMDERLIFELASKGCTDQDICYILGNLEGHRVPLDKLREKRQDILDQGRAAMRRTLHTLQQELAGAKNPIMLIWLGKQHLNQADKVESNNKQVLQLQSGELWKAAFGSVPKKREKEVEAPAPSVN
jgi:hypothetical protein